MAIFTSDELDAQITAWKAALLALASAQSYTVDLGASKRTVTKADLPEIRNTLKFLEAEQLAMAGNAGPHTNVGRPAR